MKKLIALSVLCMIIGTTGFAAETPGATGALAQDTFTIEEMLHYAIQDEWLAEAEYAALMEEFGVTRPFSNIQKAEIRHAELLMPLFERYGLDLPEKPDRIAIPSTLVESYQIGIDAEIKNIAMYEKFLADEDLPSDIAFVFTRLMNASKNHLRAFQQQASRETNVASFGSFNNGSNRGPFRRTGYGFGYGYGHRYGQGTGMRAGRRGK